MNFDLTPRNPVAALRETNTRLERIEKLLEQIASNQPQPVRISGVVSNALTKAAR